MTRRDTTEAAQRAWLRAEAPDPGCLPQPPARTPKGGKVTGKGPPIFPEEGGWWQGPGWCRLRHPAKHPNATSAFLPTNGSCWALRLRSTPANGL